MREILGVKVYTVEETAEMLGLSKATIFNYIAANKMPARRISGVYHITEENIKQYIQGASFTDPQPDKKPGKK